MSFSKETQDVRYLKFGDVCKIRRGTRFTPSLQRSGGFPIIKASNIQGGKIITDNLSYCDPASNQKSAVIRQGDIVMARTGRAGVVGINLTGREFFFNEHVFKLVPNRRFVSSRYLYLLLSRHQDEIKRLVRRGILNKSNLKEWLIPVPSLQEQARICQDLDQFPKLYKNEYRVSCLAPESKDSTGLAQVYVGRELSSSFRPFLREAENVKYLKLGEICSIVLNGTRFGFEFYKDSGFPVLKEKNIQHGQIVTDDLSYCDPEKHPKANVIKYGDVVVSSSGRVGINLIDRDFFFISTIYKFVPHT